MCFVWRTQVAAYRHKYATILQQEIQTFVAFEIIIF